MTRAGLIVGSLLALQSFLWLTPFTQPGPSVNSAPHSPTAPNPRPPWPTMPWLVVLTTMAAPSLNFANGKTATVHLASPGAGERAKLPLAGVFKDQGRPSVWLIDEARGRLIKTGVEVSAWTETSAIISGGLTTGEKVVAAGVHKLDAGTPVRIVEVVQ